MRYLGQAAMLLFMLCMLNACCTKVGCIDTINEIHLVNFRPDETDSITILTYPKSSASGNYIDSFFTSGYSRGGTDSSLIILLPEYLDRDLDYRINMISTGQSYSVTGFLFEKETCNDCFPYNPESDYHDVLKSYSVNGVSKEDMSVKIYK